MFSCLFLAVLLFISAGSLSAFAQEAVLPSALQAVKPTETLNIQIDEGQVIKLPAQASSVFIANPDIADVQVKSPQLIYIFGRRVGETTLFAADDKDNVVTAQKIVVGLNLTQLRSALTQLTGGNRIRVSSVDDMIVLAGSVETTGDALDAVRVASRYLPDGSAPENIINRLTVSGPNQVNIRVRVAEVSREAVKTLGFESTASNSKIFGDVGFSVGFDPGIALTGAAATGGLSSTWGATSLATTLTALVDDGLATVLAEPNLTALSGETASFLAGGEFPILIPDSTNGTVTVQFREYGVRLSFTPTIVNGNRISLRIRPEVSERDDSRSISLAGSTVPGLNTRRAETAVELGSGQSFAIAGLIQNNSSQDVSKYPGLGELPVIGALFRSDRFRQNQSELVIVATPYLVRPTSAENITLPTDGFVAPNDIDRWLNGRMTSEKPTPAPVSTATEDLSPASSLTGQMGFTLQ
jgi:pilus assembly protein CpaC